MKSVGSCSLAPLIPYLKSYVALGVQSKNGSLFNFDTWISSKGLASFNVASIFLDFLLSSTNLWNASALLYFSYAAFCSLAISLMPFLPLAAKSIPPLFISVSTALFNTAFAAFICLLVNSCAIAWAPGSDSCQ